MKLSDVKGDRVLDVMADLVDPVASIATDPEASDLLRPKERPDGMTTTEFVIQRVRKSLPALLKGHKEDVITILSAIDGKGRDEYVEGMTLQSLLVDLTELLTDQDFATFFTSSETNEESQ